MDFSNLFYDLHGKEGDPYELYPELKIMPDFNYTGEFDKGKLIRYINYLYSEGTPLFKKYRDDLPARKKEALRLSGIEINKRTEEGIINLFDNGVLAMVVRFLSMQKSIVWTSIITNQSSYWENIRHINEPLQGDDEKKKLEAANTKQKLLDNNQSIQDRLITLYKEFYKDDKELSKRMSDVDFLMTTPEQIAVIIRRF